MILRLTCLIVVASVLTGCRHKSPLGTYSKDDWAKDCETPIVKEDFRDPHTPGPILLDGGPAFSSAAWRYRCTPPGWALYADHEDQIVGLCVDDDTRPFLSSQGSFSDTVDHEVDRARKLITQHWGHKLAGEMLKGVAGDHCSASSEAGGPGMVRWSMGQLNYPEPEKIRSINMCCWEVK